VVELTEDLLLVSGYRRHYELKAVALTGDTPPCRAKNARRGWGTRRWPFD